MNGEWLCYCQDGAEWAGLEGAPSAQGLSFAPNPDRRYTGRSFLQEKNSRGISGKPCATEEKWSCGRSVCYGQENAGARYGCEHTFSVLKKIARVL